MATTASAPPSVDLMFLLAQAAHALNTRLTAALAGVGLTPREHCVLSKALTGEHTQGRLADLAALDKTTMVATLDRLEAAGLAERRPSHGDRRVRIVGVTGTGRQRSAEAQHIVDGVFADTLAALPGADRAAFVSGLMGLVEGPLATPVHTDRPVRRPAQRSR